MNTESFDNIRVAFESQNQFRMLAPESVAKGVLSLCKNRDDEHEQKQHAANMMDLIAANVPKRTQDNTTRSGKRTVQEVPLYNAYFTEAMIKEAQAIYKELYAASSHSDRMQKVKEFLLNFKPTISLGDALYRLSFYLIPNYNNLAKSTNCLVAFAKNILLDTRNNMLVDSALMLGGQGKSTVQTGLRKATEMMGFGCAMCHLPTVQDGVQDVFVNNEICIDDESHFEKLDLDSLNKILDKSTVTIKGKYIKEWSARSVANILVGTNFLPTDVNSRRYSVRMVDENFKLEQNFGKWSIPGVEGDIYGNSYNEAVEWTTEGWLNLFYYCNKYNIPEQRYKETSFDYGLLYQLKRALENQGTNISNINDLVKSIEQVSGDVFNWKVKQSFKNKLFMLATQLKLEVVGERKHNMYNTYDWTNALDIDETFPTDPLEKIYCYYNNNEDFKIKE